MSFSIKIDIPDEFLEHWMNDRFKDSLERISGDIMWNLGQSHAGLSGRMEAELADMLKDAFDNAEVIDG